MGRARRGGYLIEWWIGDHLPKHVHVYRGGRFVAKIEIPGLLVLSGQMNRALRSTVEHLIKEKKL